MLSFLSLFSVCYSITVIFLIWADRVKGHAAIKAVRAAIEAEQAEGRQTKLAA